LVAVQTLLAALVLGLGVVMPLWASALVCRKAMRST